MTKQSVFIDTSGFYALMDGSDRFNKEAGVLWSDFGERNMSLNFKLHSSGNNGTAAKPPGI